MGNAGRIMRTLGLLSTLLLLAACGDPPEAVDAGPTPRDAGSSDPADAGMDAGPPPPLCAGSSDGVLPPGLETLRYYEGAGASQLEMQSWAVTFDGVDYRIAEQRAYEQARFEIDRPTRIHGFRVRWYGVDDLGGADELAAGLYRDFGYNGFDMWSASPYWSGTRCVSELDADGWVTYALDAPVEITQPGLVYVGHERAGPGTPGWWLDGDTEDPEGSCDVFDDCRSAVNMPDLETRQFYNGVTVQVPYDYLVELLVEPLAEPPATSYFAPVSDISPGNRVSFGDFDADGWDDFITTGPRLFRNQGDGTFLDVTDASGLGALGVSGNGVWGDYDNDGCLDLFLFAESMTASDALIHNECDGTFTDATAASGIVDEQSYETCGDAANIRSPSPAAAWVDVNADGLLDLFVANFICWSSGATYVDTFFLNMGGGVFRDRTGRDGFTSARAASRTVTPIDADRDGDMDLLVGRYRLQRNAYFENSGTGRFVDRGGPRGLEGTAVRGAYGHTIGMAWGDLDNDGDFDVVQANLAHPRFFDFSDKTQVLMQTSPMVFEDNAGDWTADLVSRNGLRYQETHSVPSLADFNNDGDLDLVISCVYDGRPTDFYWGQGDGTFELDVLNAGITVENGWGVATSDWDHDGDVDLAMSQLFTNEVSASGRWLSVRVVGNVASNRAAIGAVVAVTSGGVTRLRQVQGGTGQGGQDSMYLHFGLGDAATVDSVEVSFVGGTRVTYAGPFDADQRLWLMEDGSVHRGWAPPPP